MKKASANVAASAGPPKGESQPSTRRVPNPDGRPKELEAPVRISVMVEADTLERLDAAAGPMRRSEAIREALEAWLEKR